MPNKENQFYLLWSPAGDRNPTFTHDSFDSALTEAKRLAETTGKTFYIVAATSKVEPAPKVLVTALDDIPF